MHDKSEAMKKIQFQTLKSKKQLFNTETRREMVDGILKANIPEKDNSIIESEMPKEIMGVGVNWNKLETVEPEAKTIEKPVIEETVEIEVEKFDINKQTSLEEKRVYVVDVGNVPVEELKIALEKDKKKKKKK